MNLKSWIAGQARNDNGGQLAAHPRFSFFKAPRALIQESLYDKFMERALSRVRAIKQGSPLDTDSMMGAQASLEQMKKIESYLALGKEER